MKEYSKEYSRKGYIKYIVALLLMATNGIVASFIPMNSYEIVFFRTLIGGAFLIVIFLLMKNKFTFWKDKKGMFFIIISGVFTGVNFMFLYESFNQVGVGIATILLYMGPVIVIGVSPFIFKEKMTWVKFAGIISVVCGLVFISMSSFSHGATPFGLFCGVMSGVTIAGLIIFNRMCESIKGLEKAICQIVCAFITIAVFVGVKQGYSFEIHKDFIIPLLIIGFINGGVALFLYFSSFSEIPAQSVAILGYIEPLAAVVFSALFLMERLTPVQYIGGVLILGGAAFGELFRRSKADEIDENFPIVE